jgi:putative methionine-R-sulfoxide reductase with GAF domain
MKTYRPARQLLSEIQALLKENRPSFHHSPLDEVIELLCTGRHYAWIGIYLAVGPKNELLSTGKDLHPGISALPGTNSKILVSIKLAAHEYGYLEVESERENAFGSVDRVLLENVANRLARFFAGSGKYITRKARGAAKSVESKPQARAPQSAPKTVRSAAVGEK